MRYLNEKAVAPLGAVLCVCACLVGCERRETVHSSPSPAQTSQPAATSAVPRAEVRSTTASIEERANDPVYQKQLAGFEKDRQRIRKQRAVIEAKMARLRAYAKAKKGLPPGVTDEQIEGALDGAPLREWHELVAARKACMAEEEKNHAAARAAVAERISRKKAGTRAQGVVPEAN